LLILGTDLSAKQRVMVAYNPHLRVEDVQSGYDIGYKNTSQNMGFYWFVPFRRVAWEKG
jgi:hypothetical protein